MTMLRAVGLLVLAVAVLAASIGAFVLKHGERFEYISQTNSGSSGARTGPNAADQPGLGLLPGQAEATARAIGATTTALAGSNTPSPLSTPVSELMPVGIGETVEWRGSRYTVHQLVDPEPPGFFTATEGNRRITFEVTQEAVDQAVAYSFALFYLRDSNGEEHVWAITNGEPGFGSGSLNPGQSNTGWITFMIPEGAEPAALMLLSGVDRVVLVELE